MALELERSLRQEANQADPTYALPRLAAAQLRKVKTCAQRTGNLLQVYLRKHHSN
jgi:histidine phosphotransfer protein HptB